MSSKRIIENYGFTEIPELDDEELKALQNLNGTNPKYADGVGAWGFNVFD